MKGKRFMALMLAAVLLLSACGNTAADESGNTPPVASPDSSAVPENSQGSEDPAVSQTPAVTEDPAVSQTPAASEDPAVSQSPAVSEDPAVSETPAVSEDPAVTESPDVAESPAVTETPVPTQTPAVTPSPAPTPVPDTSGHDHSGQMTTCSVHPTNKELGYQLERCTCGYSYISHYVDKLPSTQSVEGTYTIRYSARGKQYQTTFTGELCQVKLEIDSDRNGYYEEGTNTFSLLTLKDETVLKHDLAFQVISGGEDEYGAAGTYYYTVYREAATALAGSTMYDIFQYSYAGQFLMLTDVSIYDSKGNRVASTKDLLLTCDEAAHGYNMWGQDSGKSKWEMLDTLIATSDFEEPKVTLHYEDAEDPANLLQGNYEGLKYSFYRKPAGTVIRHSKLVQTGDTPEEIRDHFIDVICELTAMDARGNALEVQGTDAGIYGIKDDQYELRHFDAWVGSPAWGSTEEGDNVFLNGLIYFGGEKMATAVWSMLYENFVYRSAPAEYRNEGAGRVLDWIPISDQLAAKYGLTLNVQENGLIDVSNGETTWSVWYVDDMWNNVIVYIPTGFGGDTATPSNKPAPVPEGYGPIKLTRDFGMGNSTVTLSAAKETQTVLNIDGVQKTVRLITVARESTYDNEMFYHLMTKNADGSYSRQGMNAYMGNEKRYVEDLFVDSQGQSVDYVYLPYADVYLTRYSG